MSIIDILPDCLRKRYRLQRRLLDLCVFFMARALTAISQMGTHISVHFWPPETFAQTLLGTCYFLVPTVSVGQDPLPQSRRHNQLLPTEQQRTLVGQLTAYMTERCCGLSGKRRISVYVRNTIQSSWISIRSAGFIEHILIRVGLHTNGFLLLVCFALGSSKKTVSVTPVLVHGG